MAYIIDKDGVTYPIDDSKREFSYWFESAVLVDEKVFLDDHWLVTAYRNKKYDSYTKNEIDYESYVEEIFDHEPTDKELLHFLGSNGYGLNDFIQVEKIKKVDCHWGGED